MRYFSFIILFFIVATGAASAQTSSQAVHERNKEIARNFYQDLWFSSNTDKYALYVADVFTAHDIGERKNSVEPAIRQKEIADFFWNNGELSGSIDYQIAEGDLVATRWHATFEPETLFGKLALRKTDFYIINVFRIKDGKIVEFWNHRHDIDTSQTDKFLFKGLGIGLLIALIPAFYAFSLRRKLKRA